VFVSFYFCACTVEKKRQRIFAARSVRDRTAGVVYQFRGVRGDAAPRCRF